MTELNEQQVLADARRNMEELRRSIRRFHAAKLTTNEAVAGMLKSRKGLTPTQVAEKVRELRDADATTKAVMGLRDLLTKVYDREPTPSELEAGPPDPAGLGVWLPVHVIALAAIAGGSWSLSGLFDYLTEREERIQRELGISDPTTWDQVMAYGPAVALLGVGGVAAWYLIKNRKKGVEGALPSSTDQPEALPAPEEEEEEEELEEEEES